MNWDYNRKQSPLTCLPVHHHGIKVRLENGLVGRVKEIIA
ncbi:MAG: DUF2196 domain-containing protein [Bacteroidales bacterium]|nr:DUF2196 domain-containing protein [Bacteroidales bacterium]